MGDSVTLAPSLADVMSTSTTTSSPDTLIKLCLLWTVLHRTQKAPLACQGVITEQRLLDLQAKGELNDILGSSGIFGLDGVGGATGRIGGPRDDDPFRMSPIERFERYNRYSSRSLSVIGVLAGIVLILLIVALSTCIRKRRNLFNETTATAQRQNRDGFARQIIIDHIRQLRRSSSSASRRGNSAADRPPAYDDVVKPELDGASTSAAATSGMASGSGSGSACQALPDGDSAHDNDDTVTSCSSRDVFWCERDQQQHQQPPSYLEALQCQAEVDADEVSGCDGVRLGRDDTAIANSDSTATFPDTATNEVRLCDFKNESSDSETEVAKLSKSK